MSTDLTPTATPEELALIEEQAALAALDELNAEDEELVLPILKVAQQLSNEVESGDAKSGEFVNSLTGDNHGDEVELIIAGYFKGRFYAPKDDEPGDGTYNARSEVVPSNWPPEYAGQRFDEIPVAEEQTRAAANAEGGEWVAPRIQTTHNYIGLIPDAPDLPVRLSLKSTSTNAHRKIKTLLKFAPGGRPWANVIALKTVRRENAKKQPYYIVEAARGRETTPDERQLAVSLATAYQSAGEAVKLVGDADEKGEQAKNARAAVSGGDALDVS